MAGDRWILTLQDSLEEAIHVVCPKGRDQGAHLVGHAAQRPDVRLEIVWLILPHLRTGIVRGTSLRVEQALLGNFGHIQIAELRSLVLVEEDVGTFHVSVQDAQLMQRLQSTDHLYHDLPDVLLLHELLVVLALADPLENISIVCKLHHYAKQKKLLVLAERWTNRSLTKGNLIVHQRRPACTLLRMDS